MTRKQYSKQVGHYAHVFTDWAQEYEAKRYRIAAKLEQEKWLTQKDASVVQPATLKSEKSATGKGSVRISAEPRTITKLRPLHEKLGFRLATLLMESKSSRLQLKRLVSSESYYNTYAMLQLADSVIDTLPEPIELKIKRPAECPGD